MSSPAPDLFACPECDGTLRAAEDLQALEPPFSSTEGLRCTACAREFPRVDGVWVLWSDQIRALVRDGQQPTDPDAEVKWANISIYEQVSEAYGEHSDNLWSYGESLLFLKAFAREARRDRPPPEGDVLVDVGCATGVGLDIGSRGYATCVGVDISLANLRQVAAKGHVAVLADAERLPFAAGRVGLVTCFAALHHFPSPPAFVRSAHRCLAEGGALLTAHDPSRASMHMGPLARATWDLRKPVYRTLAHVSRRFYLHRDRKTQAINDIAERHRTAGGFDPDQLRATLHAAGFGDVNVFYGIDASGLRTWDLPSWQLFVLKALSFQSPLRRTNWVSLSSISIKGPPAST